MPMTSALRWANETIASRRLRNSGANCRLIASWSSPSRLERVKPNAYLVNTAEVAAECLQRILFFINFGLGTDAQASQHRQRGTPALHAVKQQKGRH